MLSNALTQLTSWEDKVLRHLADLDVCKHCITRIFRGSFCDYQLDKSEKKVRPPLSYCSACLGILEGYCLYTVGEEIAEKVLEMGYDSPTFQLGISLPQCLVTRQAAIFAYLSEKGHSNLVRDSMTIKNVTKIFLTKLVEKFTKKRMESRSPFFVKVDFSFAENSKEIAKLEPLLLKAAEKNAKNTNPNPSSRVESIQKVIRGMFDCDIKKYVEVPPKPIGKPCKHSISISHSSMWIGGRYKKNKVDVSSQDYDPCLEYSPLPSPDNTAESSTTNYKSSAATPPMLKLVVSLVRKFFHCGDIRFHPNSLLDMDLEVQERSLPFAIEILDPKVTCATDLQYNVLTGDINSSSEMFTVHEIQKVTRKEVDVMKKMDASMEKVYKGVVACTQAISSEDIRKVNEMGTIQIEQKTPIRLMHVSNTNTMKKSVSGVVIRPAPDCSGHTYEFELNDKSGVHVKEFILGDFGRTHPSLASLLKTQLSLVKVSVTTPTECDWPIKEEVSQTEDTADE